MASWNDWDYSIGRLLVRHDGGTLKIAAPHTGRNGVLIARIPLAASEDRTLAGNMLHAHFLFELGKAVLKRRTLEHALHVFLDRLGL